MYIWELMAIQLQDQGWNLWHVKETDTSNPTEIVVYLNRPGFSFSVVGPNLPEAYAAASRRANEYLHPSPQRGIAPPHFYRARYTAQG